MPCSRPPRSRQAGRPPILGILPLLVAALLSGRAFAAQDPPAGPPAAPDPGTGALYMETATGLVPLPALGMAVELEVTGPLVQGTVRQTFRNDTTRVIDAVYLFPLPERAALDSLEMRIGDRLIRSVVREREEARAVYETARREGRKAGLVEQARRGLFRTSAANINPGEEVTVVLRYFDQADFTGGLFSLAFPLTWTERYTPGLPAGSEPSPAIDPPAATGLSPESGAPERGAASIPVGFVAAAGGGAPRATVRVHVDAGLPLAAIRSTSHPARVTIEGARGTIETGEVPADRDFTLEWRVAAAARPQGAVFLEERDEGAYGLAMLVPPSGGPDSPDASGLPTRTLFILDVSGSMAGPSLEQARSSLLRALDRLRPGDEFGILKFSTGNEPFRERFQPAVPARLEEARAWIAGLGAEGGTEILAALQRAEGMMAAEDRRMDGRIVLITDGAVDTDDTSMAAVLAGLGATRLNAIGIGPAPNRGFMRTLARIGRGACAFIGSPEEVGPKLDAFLERIDRPVLTDLALEWDGAPPRDVFPDRLPDLHAAEPLLVSFRLDPGHPGTRVVLHGSGAAGPLVAALEVGPDAPQGAGIAARWARARVDALLDDAGSGRSAVITDPARVREEVITLAREFHLVTPFTSLVAVEERPTAAGASIPALVPSVTPGSADGVALPQTGTLDPLLLRVGAFLVALGVVLVFVRRLLMRRFTAA